MSSLDWDEEQTRTSAFSKPDADHLGPLTGRLIGDYRIGEQIGEGGHGVVYRARQESLQRDVVIKVLKHALQSGEGPERRLRFLREAQLASDLDHPYAAHIYGFGVEDDGVMWIAMEMVRGTPLSLIIRSNGSLPLARFLPLLEKICELLDTAHERGLVHRDIKPSNIMVLSRAGRLLPKLLDFGIARKVSLEAEEGENPDFEKTGKLPRRPRTRSRGSISSTPPGPSLGSPSYMAPEQWHNAAMVDSSADQYALGVLTYETLTGRPPFRAATLDGLAHAHTNERPPSLGAGFPPEMDEVLARAMAKDPADRYANVLAFARALHAAAALGDQGRMILPLDQPLVQRYLTHAPQPLADIIAVLDTAQSPRTVVRAMSQLVDASAQYLGILALSAAARLGQALDLEAPETAHALEVLQRTRGRATTLDAADWASIAHGLSQPFFDRPDAHAVPELVLLFEPRPDDPQAQAQAQAQVESRSFAVRLVRLEKDVAALMDQDPLPLQDVRACLPGVEGLLRELVFVCDYPVAVAAHQRIESWAGARRAVHPLIALVGDYEPPVGEVLVVGADHEPLLILSPLVQRLEPAPQSRHELFLMTSGRGRQGTSMIAYPAGFERHTRDIWPWLCERIPGLASADADAENEALAEEVAPYMGLSSFSRADADRFFGREREVEDCLNRLKIEPLLTVVGPSGSGKSSFVQAGLLPALPDTWRAFIARPGARPIVALARVLCDALELDLGFGLDARTLADDEHAADELGRALRARALDENRPVLIIIDQFEELLTLCADERVRRRYAELLMGLAQRADDPVRLILTLRDDFLLRAQRIAPLARRLAPSLVLLTTPPPETLEQIVIEPARRAGYEFDDPALPKEMVEAVAAEPSALALLSFTASKLWDERDRQFKRLRRAMYDSLGGVGGALAQHAEGMLEAMSEHERAMVREVFRQLVTADGTRAILTRRELSEILDHDEDAQAVLESLIGARLLVASEMGGRAGEGDEDGEDDDANEDDAGAGLEDRIEVVHEALLSSWPRLVDWRREDAENVRLRDQVRAAARQWHERGRPSGLLWRGDALLEYRAWHMRYQGALTQIEEAFTRASMREHQRGQRIRRALVVVALLAMAAVVVVVMGFNRDLEKERDRVRALAEESRTRLVEMQREQGRQALLDDKPMQAFAYLRAALDTGREDDRATRFMIARAVDALEGERRVIPAHEDNVTALAFRPDGRAMASASQDGTIKLWDPYTGALLHQARGHDEGIFVLGFDPTGAYLVTGMRDGAVQVQSASDLTPVWRDQHEGPIFKLAFPRQEMLMATASMDRTARLWRTDTGQVERVFSHPSVVQSVALDADATRVVTGAGDQIVRVWDAASGELLTESSPLGQVVGEVAVSPDGRFVAGASWNGRILIVPKESAANGPDARIMNGHDRHVLSLVFSPASDLLASAGTDDTVRLWDPRTGDAVASLRTNPSGTVRVLFAPQGGRMYTAGYDGLARSWSIPSDIPVWTYHSHRDMIWPADISPDGALLVTGGFDNTIRVWDARQTAYSAALPDHEVVLHQASEAAHGPWLATVDEAGTVRVWQREHEQLVHTLPMDASPSPVVIKRIAWHPSAPRLLGSGGPRAVEWDAETGALIRAFGDQGERVRCALYSPDGTRVATGGSDGTIKLYLASTGELEATIANRGGAIRAMAFAPDGTRLVSAAEDGVLRFFEPRAGAPESLEIDHGQVIRDIRFSRDGTRLIVASVASTAVIYSSTTGDSLVSLQGHDNEITSADFSPDGSLVATASADRTIKVWDAGAGTQLWSRKLDQKSHNSVEFSADGDHLLVGFGVRVQSWKMDREARTLRELDAYAACRVHHVLEHGTLNEIALDWRACSWR